MNEYDIVKRKPSVFSRAYKFERLISFGQIVFEEDDDGEGKGGKGGKEKQFSQKDLDKAIAKATQPFDGMKDKNAELLEYKNKNKKSIKKLEEIGDLDELLAFKSQVESDEILKLAKDGKFPEAIELATDKLKATHATDIEKLVEEIAELRESGVANETRLHTLLIDSAATRAFVEAKGVEEAIGDIILRAKEFFSVEEGDVVARHKSGDNKGDLITGEDGAIKIPEWIEGLKKTAPHLFPASVGGMAGGSGGEKEYGSDDTGRLAAANKGPDELRAWKNKQRKSARGE